MGCKCNSQLQKKTNLNIVSFLTAKVIGSILVITIYIQLHPIKYIKTAIFIYNNSKKGRRLVITLYCRYAMSACRKMEFK